MKALSFSVRDLNRSPSKVLKAADELGTVRIRARGGKMYCLQAEQGTERMGLIRDYTAWRREIGMPRLSKAQAAALDRMISGS